MGSYPEENPHIDGMPDGARDRKSRRGRNDRVRRLPRSTSKTRGCTTSSPDDAYETVDADGLPLKPATED